GRVRIVVRHRVRRAAGWLARWPAVPLPRRLQPAERDWCTVTASSGTYVVARRLCGTLLCNAVIVSSLAAQSGGGAWVSIPGSVRAAGLGGAGAALVGDAAAALSNPAGIATI